MSYYPAETAVPPPITTTPNPPGAVLQQKAGMGYPVGTPLVPIYWPTTMALGATSNPSGNANSPGEYTPVVDFPYTFKTWEQKAAATVPPGVFATPVTVAANQPYPTTP
jgi:hypothetical protein